MKVLHHINQALRAHALFHLDVEYMVKDGAVVIVDEFTGTLMPGGAGATACTRRSKPRNTTPTIPEVKIERENQTLATGHLPELLPQVQEALGHDRHGRHRGPGIRQHLQARRHGDPDQPRAAAVEEADSVYRTEKEKYDAIVSTSSRSRRTGRPVLVGTVSIEKSERLSKLLKLRGIKHVVLNAKFHAQEAEIVAQAGRKNTSRSPPTWRAAAPTSCSAATPSSWRASRRWPTRSSSAAQGPGEVRRRRGLRLLLPPRQLLPRPARRVRADLRRLQEVDRRRARRSRQLGGLHIIATERHEARRIDNQLRGRAGRQGDPGSSRFYLSLEDDLMRIFGSDRISA
jgi:preprotein translocase subunit SecA